VPGQGSINRYVKGCGSKHLNRSTAERVPGTSLKPGDPLSCVLRLRKLISAFSALRMILLANMHSCSGTIPPATEVRCEWLMFGACLQTCPLLLTRIPEYVTHTMPDPAVKIRRSHLLATIVVWRVASRRLEQAWHQSTRQVNKYDSEGAGGAMSSYVTCSRPMLDTTLFDREILKGSHSPAQPVTQVGQVVEVHNKEHQKS